METKQVESTLTKAFNINLDAAIEADPGSEHNLREEWEATVNKVGQFVNRVAIQAKGPGGGTGTGGAQQAKKA